MRAQSDWQYATQFSVSRTCTHLLGIFRINFSSRFKLSLKRCARQALNDSTRFRDMKRANAIVFENVRHFKTYYTGNSRVRRSVGRIETQTDGHTKHHLHRIFGASATALNVLHICGTCSHLCEVFRKPGRPWGFQICCSLIPAHDCTWRCKRI